jgi:hypothetical protein
MAITLVNGKDMRKLTDIESLIGYEIKRGEMPEELGPGPEWRSQQNRGRGRRKPNFKKGGGRNRNISKGRKGKGPNSNQSNRPKQG